MFPKNILTVSRGYPEQKHMFPKLGNIIDTGNIEDTGTIICLLNQRHSMANSSKPTIFLWINIHFSSIYHL